jgi:RPA family protein
MSDSSVFQRYEREPARRVFAAELREITHHFKEGTEDKSPTFVLLPTGERCNRVFLVGILNDKKKSEGDNVFYQVKIRDPSGIFFISAGSYQPEAMHQIASIETPTEEGAVTYVAVIGKPNIFHPPDGRLLVSVRAESVAVVDKSVYDCWILDASTRTLERIETTEETPDHCKAKEIYNHSPDVWKKMVHEALNMIKI